MGSKQRTITTQTLQILATLMSSVDELSGSDIARETKLMSGTLYPILMRLEKAGWVTSRWETDDPHALGRPRRRFYQVTAMGAKNAKAEFQKLVPLGGLVWE